MTSSSSAPWPDAWPFVTCRGFRVGDTVVLAPDVVVDAHVLAPVSTPSGETRPGWQRREVTIAGVDYTVFVRKLPAPPDLVGEDGAVTDEHGRAISITEGVVATGRPAGLPAPLLEAAHREALAAFARFWLADDPRTRTATAPLLRPDRPAPDLPVPPPGGVRARYASVTPSGGPDPGGGPHTGGGPGTGAGLGTGGGPGSRDGHDGGGGRGSGGGLPPGAWVAIIAGAVLLVGVIVIIVAVAS